MQSSIPSEEGADDWPLVVVASIPNHDDVATQMLQKVAEKRNNFVSRKEPVRFGSEVQTQSLRGRRHTDAADYGDLVPMSPIGVQPRSLANDRPGAPHNRIEEQAGFIDQNEVGVGVVRFF